jgi:hypothetical protein
MENRRQGALVDWKIPVNFWILFVPRIDWLYAMLESKVVTVDTHPTATPNSATAPCA